MQNNSENFAIEDGKRIANSPAGKALLMLLQQTDSEALNRAMTEAAAGNYNKVQEILTAVTDNESVRQLLLQLGGQLNG